MQLKTTYKDIWNVAYPLMLGSIAQTIINVTDTAFLGRVGEIELGASAIGGLFYFVLVFIGSGFGVGAQIMIARKTGEKNDSQTGEIFDHVVYLQIGLSIILFIILKFVSPVLLQYFLRSDKIYHASMEFIDYRSWGTFFALMTIAFRSFYVGIAKTSVLIWSTGLMAILNVILNYCLIFGNFGFTKMGIAGSALASNISEISGVVFFIIFTLYKIDIRYFNLFRFNVFNFSLIKKITNLSLPIVIQSIFSLGAWFVFFMVIEKMGEQQLAISNIIRGIMMIIMTPIWGYFSATNTMVSNIIGQGKSDEVMPLIKKICVLSFFSAVVVILGNVLFPRELLSIFTKDQTLIEGAIGSLYVVSFLTILFSIFGIFLSAVSGTGNTRFAMTIEIFVILLHLIYVYLVGIRFHLQIEFLWAAEIFYWVMSGSLCLWYLRSKRWIKIKL